MKCISFFILFLLSLITSGQSAREIVQKAEDKMRGTSSQSVITIKTIRPSWSREMTVKAWLKGNDLSVIVVTAPAKDKGIVFLKRKKEVWNWIPTLEKSIKLPPSMMSQSWMGTDFSNDDLVKESSVMNDYDHTLIGDTLLQGRSCHVILLIPKPEASVVWGKVILIIDKKDFLQLQTRFYDEENFLINTMTGYDFAMMNGRFIPTRFEMLPADKPGQKTVLIYKDVKFDVPIDDALFSKDKMKDLSK